MNRDLPAKILLSVTKKDAGEYIPFAKKVGFDGIDYKASISDLFLFPAQVVKKAKHVDIPILSLHQPRWLIPYTPPLFIGNMIRLATQFPDLQRANHHLSGVKNIVSFNNLSKYIQTAEKQGVNLSFESNPKKFVNHFFPKAAHEPKAFAAFAQKHNLPITMDIAHIAHHGVSIPDFFAQYHEQIALLHMSDFKDGVGHLPLGKGQLPIEQLLQAIKKKNWNKLITFEIKNFSQSLSKGAKLEQIENSLRLVRKYLA